jgi:chlorobactene glucosyltransferase
MEITVMLGQILFSFQGLIFCLPCLTSCWISIFGVTIKRTSAIIKNDHVDPDLKRNINLPSVLIIVPARNEEKYIQRCVRSILAQNYPSLEVLVIDDNSSDQTLKVVKGIRDDRLRTISIEEPPAGWARKAWASHVGFINCSGDLILFTDADTCYLDKNTLLNCVFYMERQLVKAITGVPLLELNDFCSKMVMPLLNLFSDFLNHPIIFGDRKNQNKIIGSFFLIRRDILNKLNGFNSVRNSFQEDSDMGYQLYNANIAVTIVKISPMVSAMWSRSYETLRQGITRIVAYDMNKKNNNIALLCVFLFTMVSFPYLLLALDINLIYHKNILSPFKYIILAWIVALCIIPVIGHIVVNILKHKTNIIYSFLVLPASFLLLYCFISNAILLRLYPSETRITWKQKGYLISNKTSLIDPEK